MLQGLRRELTSDRPVRTLERSILPGVRCDPTRQVGDVEGVMDSTAAKDEAIQARLRAIARGLRHNAPTADIEVMLEEIERGYNSMDEDDGQEREEP